MLESRKRNLIFTIGVVAILLIGAISLSAEEFKSVNGKFRIAYPPSWMQVDYRTADYYISQSSGKVDYEAAFMDRAAPAFFDGNYLILTIDTVGELTDKQVDSAVVSLAAELSRKIVEVSAEEFMTSGDISILAYDTTNQAVAVVSQVVIGQDYPKKNILVSKFYNRGVANLYFYSAETEFDNSLLLFKQIFATFSTENVARTGTSDVKVYDPNSDKGIMGISVPIFSMFVIILIVIIVRKRRKKA